jgi:hypothetical protein
MAITTTVLFDRPQAEVASVIVQKMAQSVATSIVTGFVTPSGVDAISKPILARPSSVANFIVGSATFPGFEALDDLIAAGVPSSRLHVHLGHTQLSGGRKNPFKRYHPMLHSKIYYMDHGGGEACAFIGSHNVTGFALQGLNGEAAVLLEGPINSSEFQSVRDHINEARVQSVAYRPDMKEALAWWTGEFIDGMKAEMAIPRDSTIVRTIIIFATTTEGRLPKMGDEIYFEIPAGIEQIESLKTETHLFIFDKLPSTAGEAIDRIASARASLNCLTIGVENKRGNLELNADWRIDMTPLPVLAKVAGGTLRPQTATGMQQVRVQVKSASIGPFEYYFDRQRVAWDPVLSSEQRLVATPTDVPTVESGVARLDYDGPGWRLVTGLKPRADLPQEKDQAVLMLVAPESGSFLLVSLRRRLKRPIPKENE